MNASLSNDELDDGPSPDRPSRVRRRVRAVGRRLIHLLLVLFLVSLGTFSLLQFAPGDPAVTTLGEGATIQQVAELRHELGLDRSVVTQYREWISHAATGDLGTSLTPPRLRVAEQIKAALPISLELAVLAVVMALLVSVPVAVWSAYRQGGLLDRVSSAASSILLAVPTFVSGLILALVLTLSVHWFPRAQWVRITSQQGVLTNLHYAFLPALALALPLMAQYTRVLRAEMLQTLREDFITAARAKGLRSPYVLFRHALRPSSFTLVTLSAVNLGHLLGGTAIVESIYGLPGLGSVLLRAVNNNDFPLVQGIALFVAVMFVLLNLLIDGLYSFLDPRSRRVSV